MARDQLYVPAKHRRTIPSTRALEQALEDGGIDSRNASRIAKEVVGTQQRDDLSKWLDIERWAQRNPPSDSPWAVVDGAFDPSTHQYGSVGQALAHGENNIIIEPGGDFGVIDTWDGSPVTVIVATGANMYLILDGITFPLTIIGGVFFGAELDPNTNLTMIGVALNEVVNVSFATNAYMMFLSCTFGSTNTFHADTPVAFYGCLVQVTDPPGSVTARGETITEFNDDGAWPFSLPADSVGPNELQETGVVAGAYGDLAHWPAFLVDEDGRIEGVVNVPRLYRFDQAIPDTVWTITHNMGTYPSVSVVDTTGEEIDAAIDYVDQNIIVITFTVAMDGSAYLN